MDADGIDMTAAAGANVFGVVGAIFGTERWEVIVGSFGLSIGCDAATGVCNCCDSSIMVKSSSLYMFAYMWLSLAATQKTK